MGFESIMGDRTVSIPAAQFWNSAFPEGVEWGIGLWVAVAKTMAKQPFEIIGAVVLPEHIHFWEHTIRDEQDLQRHLDYIHFNPVKHGLVPCPYWWEFSVSTSG